MKVAITGGTGTLGQALTSRFLAEGAERVVIVSRDEVKQAQMAAAFGSEADIDGGRIRFFLGDVRDRDRIVHAFWDCDVVVHAAALKRVDAVAYNPTEVRKTNIEGSANVSAAAMAAGVGRVLMISSDKAVQPTNIYGVTKAAMEHEAVATNAMSVPRGTRIACTRYGNVLGSRGSVVHIWRDKVEAGERVPLTDERMTRFWLTIGEACDVVLQALDVMEGGEIFVPTLPAMSMSDLALAMDAPGIFVTGLRPGGEKLHEMLATPEECARAVSHNGSLWIIPPERHSWRQAGWDAKRAGLASPYCSETWGWRLTVGDMRKMLEAV